jgi:hypothetical protein
MARRSNRKALIYLKNDTCLHDPFPANRVFGTAIAEFQILIEKRKRTADNRLSNREVIK